jgi:peptide chain release factor 3
MEVCRMRDTPIISFVNKMDREIREPLELLDEIENVLNIRCVPITWPLGMGRDFAGVYNLLENKLYVYKAGFGSTITDIEVRDGYDHADIREKVGELAWASFEESLELVQMANEPLDRELFLQGKQTPVLFGTALGNFAVDHVLDAFINWAPEPKASNTRTYSRCQ